MGYEKKQTSVNICTKLYITMNESSSSSASASSFALQLSTACALPAALKCAIELDLLDFIKKANAPISAAELAAQVAAANPQAHLMIDRLLHLLAANNILRCTAGSERRYSLAPVCDFLTMNEDGASFAPLFLMNHHSIFMQSWYHLKDAVVEGGVPFERAYGMGGFVYAAKDPRANKIFNQAMSESSTIVMREILRVYKGFEGVKRLVDVGGGVGASLKMIVSDYPLIDAVNFDLPHVIQVATPHKGVEHVSGNMFAGVPRGDAILMKWICHDWSDGECLTLLKNCHKALPSNGKLIIVERFISEMTEKDASASVSLAFDVIMLAYYGSGKERTEMEIQALAKASGFNEFKKAACAMGFWIMEFYK